MIDGILTVVKAFPIRGRAFLIRILAMGIKRLSCFPYYLGNLSLPIYLNLNDDTSINLILNDGLKHERGILSVLERLSDKNVNFWDIGSNYGFYPYYFMSNNLYNEVCCFEPNPEIFRLLELTLKNDSRFKLFNVGLGTHEDLLNFYYSDVRSDLGSFSPNANPKNLKKKLIEVVSIEKFLRQYAAPHVVKIDVEGFELEVIKGFSSLNDIYPILIVEWIDSLQNLELHDFMKYFDNSWHIYYIGQDGELFEKKHNKCTSDLLLVSERSILYPKFVKEFVIH